MKMAFDPLNNFETYRITKGQYIPKEGGTAIAIPCTGKLTAEADISEITKKCEGVVSDSVPKVNFLTVTISGHFALKHLRELFGLSVEGLKTGVYKLNKVVKSKAGTYTFEVWNMHETEKMLIAFPNMTYIGGFALNIENGVEEIAEVELEFKAMVDTEGNFYYEGLESDISESQVKTDWGTKFTPTLVKSPGV